MVIAVQLTPKDGEMWKRVAQVARDIGSTKQSVYCYSKASSLMPKVILSALLQGAHRLITVRRTPQ